VQVSEEFFDLTRYAVRSGGGMAVVDVTVGRSSERGASGKANPDGLLDRNYSKRKSWWAATS